MFIVGILSVQTFFLSVFAEKMHHMLYTEQKTEGCPFYKEI